MSAVDLIVSMIPKRPAHKEQHLCADKAYDSDDLREFAASAGYIAHIKINPRRKDAAEGRRSILLPRSLPRGFIRLEVESRAHDFMVEQASQPPYSLVEEGRKLAGTLVQLACAHILLNLAVFG